MENFKQLVAVLSSVSLLIGCVQTIEISAVATTHFSQTQEFMSKEKFSLSEKAGENQNIVRYKNQDTSEKQSTITAISQFKHMITVLKDVTTIVAIIIGGIWTYRAFIRRRESYPKAKVTHRITCRIIPEVHDSILLQVCAIVENIGDIMLELDYDSIQIQQVFPLIDYFKYLIEHDLDPVVHNELLNGQEKKGTKYTEILWPTLINRERDFQDEKVEIESGESQEFNYDFILKKNVLVIRISTYYRNIKKAKRSLGWGLVTIYEIDIPPAKVILKC